MTVLLELFAWGAALLLAGGVAAILLLAHVFRHRQAQTAAAVLYILVISACAVLLAERAVGRARLDLTEEGIYTLAEGTRNILAALNEPVTMTLYYARTAALSAPEEIRVYNSYFHYVRDVLREYEALSRGMLTLRVVDPLPFSDEEQEAVELGLQRIPINRDGTKGFLFGLAVRTELGKTGTIAFLSPDQQRFLEYELSKLVVSVVEREKKKIGVISSLPIAAGDESPYMQQMRQMQGLPPQNPWLVVQHLRQRYEVQTLEGDEAAIPEDIDFLMVVHPKELPETRLFAIDQYVMAGKPLLVLVDPHCIADEPAPDPSNPYAAMGQSSSSELNALLRRWGVETKASEIAADRTLAVKAMTRRNAPAEPFPIYMALRGEECFNRSEVVTENLERMNVLFAGALHKTETADAEIVPLLRTTRVGNVWTVSSPVELRFPNADTIRKAVSDGVAPVLLACLIHGKLKSNFPEGIEVPDPDAEQDGAAAEEKKEGAEAEQKEEAPKTKRLPAVAEAAEGASVLVLADVDCVSDGMAYYNHPLFGPVPVFSNADFLLNAIDFLAGNRDLISVRARGRMQRPFEVVAAIEKEADEATAAEEERINEKIDSFRKELGKLGASATEENIQLIRQEAVEKRRTLEAEILKAEKERRLLKAKSRDRIEDLERGLKIANVALAPAVILLIAIVLGLVRYAKAKRYAARRLRG